MKLISSDVKLEELSRNKQHCSSFMAQSAKDPEKQPTEITERGGERKN